MENEYQYYRLDEILKRDAHYNIIFGERSNGKTYAVLEYGIKQYARGRGQLAIIRRWDEDFRAKRGASLFSAHVRNGLIAKYTKGKWDSVYYYSGRWFLCKKDGDKMVKDEEPFAYAFALNTMEHDKSTSFPNITTILFDEFLTRDNYLIDEFIYFTNTISTIVRGRDNVKIFMLGNTVNQYSPYWTEMGLKHVKSQEQGTIDVYTYGDSKLKVAVEYTAPSQVKKASDFYFAFDNPKLNMIKSGAWEFDNYPHKPLPFKPKDIIFRFFIVFQDEIVQCDVILVDNNCFIFAHRKTTELKDLDYDLIYTLEASPKPNYRKTLQKAFSNVEKRIVELFAKDKVFYSDNEIGEIVRNYLMNC